MTTQRAVLRGGRDRGRPGDCDREDEPGSADQPRPSSYMTPYGSPSTPASNVVDDAKLTSDSRGGHFP
jgi:hypothetical protein